MEVTKQKFITTKELAEILRVSPMTVYRLAKTGAVPSYRVGKNFRFIWDEVVVCLPRVQPDEPIPQEDTVAEMEELEQLAKVTNGVPAETPT